MALKLYDTATGAPRDFAPLQSGRVGIYQCGATVQGPPHVGHLRPAVVFDVLRRWLERQVGEVTFIRNVTDIDDKILAKASQAGQPWWAWAHRFEREFTAAYQALGVAPPSYEPRATGHVPEMIAFIDRLIERGHAYTGEVGNVYFDVASFGAYGELTHQRVVDMAPADDGNVTDKRSPHDFALWKASKPGEEDASWATPWGRGRPGWHLECSTMALRYLGESFDIHCGGLDLRFPHHENEQAQSRAAGYGFAQLWLHNGLLTEAGVKMSKSLGNSWLLEELIKQVEPVVVRYALTAAHYRSTLEFSIDTLHESAAAWERVTGFVRRASERCQAGDLDQVALPEGFVQAMDDDLNTAGALAQVHEAVRRGNTALTDFDNAELALALTETRAMLAVLGLDPLARPWDQAGSVDQASTALDALVTERLEARAKARAARDWAKADSIRDALAGAGIQVEDSPAGVRWQIDQPGPNGSTSP
ncbi:MAG: cysteine--tRNA ligase [Micrococcales bacterium]|nr:cysteine--tRNA ligase [Micrococcales bacterium]